MRLLFFQEVAQLVVGDDIKIKDAGLGRRFPFISLGQTAGPGITALDRHQPERPALAPQTQRNTAVTQGKVGGIVVGIEQPIFLRRRSPEGRMIVQTTRLRRGEA